MHFNLPRPYSAHTLSAVPLVSLTTLSFCVPVSPLTVCLLYLPVNDYFTFFFSFGQIFHDVSVKLEFYSASSPES